MIAEACFRERLRHSIEATRSLLCVGLDPDPADHPNPAAVERSCLALMESTSQYACAFKPNVAFFECHGSGGYAVLERLRSQAPAERLWLVDAKRGDVGNTAAAYVTALFDVLGADAVTVNPLMGRDAVIPFLRRPGRGAFLLTRTSNPGADDLLDRQLQGGPTVYEHLADLGNQWDTLGALGFVVGATALPAITVLRRAHAEVPLLIPGVGAQGGSLETAVSAGLDHRSGGMLINVSRAIANAPGGPAVAAEDFWRRIEVARLASATRAV